MEALYALLGVVLGIAIDKAVRRSLRDATGRPHQARESAPDQRSFRFVARDYYDR